MAASFTRVASLVVQQLAAADSYTTTPSDPRFYTQGIKDAVNEADAFVCGVILASNSPWKGSFTPTTSTVAHLGLIPNHVGDIVSVTVDGEGANLWDKNEIEWEKDNSLTLTTIKPKYWIDSNQRLYHNGTTATATYFTFTASVADPPVLQAPEAFEEVIASKALAFLINVEGENTAAAQFYDNHWKSALALLLAGGSNAQVPS